VLSFAFNEKGGRLGYAVGHPDGKSNGLFVRDLAKSGRPEKALSSAEKTVFSQLTWQKKGDRLAYLSSVADEKGNPGPASLWLWDEAAGNPVQAVSTTQTPEGWLVPPKARLIWSEDEKLIFFGLMPKEVFELKKEPEPEGKEAPKAVDLYDMNKILEKRGVDVWHWNDPQIIPQQKKEWPRLIERNYHAVYRLDTGRMAQLSDPEMPDLEIPENPRLALGFSSVPHLKEVTWDDLYQDVYLIDLAAGTRKKILDRLRYRPSLSPDGRFVLYFNKRSWHLYDVKSGTTRNLTDALKIPFYEEEEDRPQEPRPYGSGGWLEDGSTVLLYDRFDIWKISSLKNEAVNLTAGEGRKTGLTFRILRLDPEQKSLKKDQPLLLSAYHNREKFKAFYGASVAKEGVRRLLEDKKTFNFVAKARKSDALLFTREGYDEFPDIWASDLEFRSPRKITEANPQVKDFAWGTSELVEWQSQDGLPLQGVLIKPGNYEPGRRYPVLVYFYERMSDRLHRFNEVVVNHRPCFPFYAGNGYAIFLPDIVYETGRPGLSAVKCLIPGVQKIIDLGVADPKAIALHGHSWGGYETAFVITQTNLFRAAIAGAAVGNMTSAYSGIRWESGLARQFQYEKDQSRIGRSLWENRDLFIENSPVFYADRIQTPLLLMAGDEDGAVPWEQSIELYLAMRRLGKDCVFLQYRGEPHHPQKLANKLDYSIRMKQYLDHYLKGEPAPHWISGGVAYQGK
jgi:dipeptidyl aminopeptidase/acylaminoacyl peptidase